jgi:hypothetical protein
MIDGCDGMFSWDGPGPILTRGLGTLSIAYLLPYLSCFTRLKPAENYSNSIVTYNKTSKEEIGYITKLREKETRQN